MSKIVKIILIIVILALIGTGIYYALNQMGYIQALKMAVKIQKQTALSKEDQQILSRLKKIMVLPNDVNPTMAVITDIETLKKQQPGFFANAKNGDHLIVYSDMAIIFDAEANKIVKVGPVQLAQNQVQSVPFAIYNSTADDAKTAEMENKIKTAFGNAVVSVKEKAAYPDYPETLVIDLVGNNPEIARIAEAIGGKVVPLPEGEKKPEGAEVLVIIGK